MFYAAVAEDTLEYVLRDLTSPDGAFYSAEDAIPDPEVPQAQTGSGTPEKREGAFYVWTAAEMHAVCSARTPTIVSGGSASEPGQRAGRSAR